MKETIQEEKNYLHNIKVTYKQESIKMVWSCGQIKGHWESDLLGVIFEDLSIDCTA